MKITRRHQHRRHRARRALAALAIPALVLSACSTVGDQGSATPAQPDETSSEAPASDGDDIKVAFISQVEGIPYFAGFKAGAEEAAEEFGITYTQAGPSTVDATEQLRIFNSLVQQGYDAIAVSALDPRSLNPAIAEARAAGVTVITSDSDAPDSEREVMVLQASDEGLGAGLMDQLVEAVGKTEGQYAIVSGAADADNMNSWAAAVQERAAAEYPGFELVGGVRFTTDTAQALKETQDLMTAFPDLDGVISLPSTAMPGVAQAVQNAGAAGKVQVVGLASPLTAKSFFEAGSVYSTVLWDVPQLGRLTVWAMLELLEGRSFEAENTVPGISEPVAYDESTKTLLLGPPTVFNKDNADDYEF